MGTAASPQVSPELRAGDLAALVEGELRRPPPAAARLLAERIRSRHGPTTAAVLFYGSCLRRGTSEGVLDFYALVDSYRAAYSSRALALANAALPPNVFYLEADSGGGERLRAKYAVVTLRDFARGAAGAGLRTGIWARFCQPALAVDLRDPEATRAVVEAVALAHLTAVRRALPLLPVGQTLSYEALWQRVFRETYAGEMRPEALASIEALYRADPQRYDRAARTALHALTLRRVEGLDVEIGSNGFRIVASPPRDAGPGRALRRPLAKAAYAAQLFKTAFTFGDWLPYALWKLERHTGTHIEASERQRRHPLLFGWPLLWRVLVRRELR
jgi:hypothetical protein